MALLQLDNGVAKLLQVVEYPVGMAQLSGNTQQTTIVVGAIGQHHVATHVTEVLLPNRIEALHLPEVAASAHISR